jgi:hypothetical protein
MCQIDPYAVIRENLELICSGHRAADGRDALMALPRAWLLSRIEAAADPMLDRGGAPLWAALLSLYRGLDAGLHHALARRAACHPDPEISRLARDPLPSTR